ncbi:MULTISPECIES: tetratricopeptide repeat protein [Gracilibacillus]|uniref:tetratricopeptide repeat protein n=1 Tax=Gracilibacillus TaxID=74385 RepID=UPI000826086E|nr:MULTISPECIES: tetratricopeptide repeat protein [Gracilibacillus]
MDIIEQSVEMIQRGEVEQALTLLMDTAKTADVNTQLEITQIFVDLGNHDLAEEVLQEILAIEPENGEAKIMLADIMTDNEQDEQAITLLNEITEDNPNYLQALVQLADLYQVQGLFEVAEQKLLAAKNMAPDEPIIDFALGELLFSAGEYHKSIVYYENVRKLTQEFANVNIDSRLAEAYALNGEFETSLAYYQTLDTEDPDILFRYGFMAYKSERYEIAIKTWENLLKGEVEYPSVYLYLARAYEQEGLMDEAYQTAITGVEMDPLNKEMRLTAGQICLKAGEYHEAITQVKRAISIDNEYQEALLFLIEVFKTQEDYQEIITLLTIEMEVEELDGIFAWELAQAYNEEEAFKEALNAYQSAYNKLNKDTDFLKDYGYFLVEEGNIHQAIQVFEEYLQLEPSDFDIAQNLERLKEQHGDTLL